MRALLLLSVLSIALVVAAPVAQAHCFVEYVCAPDSPPGCEPVAATLNAVNEVADRVVCHT